MIGAQKEWYPIIKNGAVRDKVQLIQEKCAGRKVLDLGCIGHTHARAEEPNWLHRKIKDVASEVTGVDMLVEDAKILNRQGYNILVQDVTNLHLDCKYDVVVAGDIIEHLLNIGQFLTSVSRVLKPGGEFIITTPNPFYLDQFLSVLYNGYPTINDDHTCFIDPFNFFQMIQKDSFYVVSEFYWLSDSWSFLSGNRKMLMKNTLRGLINRLFKKRWHYLRSDFCIILKLRA